MRNFVFGFGVLAICLAASAPASATITGDLVSNGGFESNTGSPPNGNFPATPWVQSGNTQFTQLTSLAPYVHTGVYGAQLGPENVSPTFAGFGNLYQDLDTSAAIGTSYNLSFWLISQQPNIPGPLPPSTNEFQVWLGGSGGTGGTMMMDLPNYFSPGNAYTQLSVLNFVPTSGTTELRFSFFNNGAFFGLDDASMTPSPLAPTTPEPSSLALVGIGAILGGLVLARRRKRAVATA
jgi:hypothetical protein